jgi:large subunit ribosomal protein L20
MERRASSPVLNRVCKPKVCGAIRTAAAREEVGLQKSLRVEASLPPAAKRNKKGEHHASCKTRNQTPRQAQKDIERASGYFLTKSKLYRSAKEAVDRALKFAYSGRKQKKRQYRSIWIVRIGAAAKLNGLNYNQFISGLKKAGVELDRKILADLAVKDAAGFAHLAEQAKKANAAATA